MKDNAVFVFGSNTGGIHGAGAAKEAYKNHGARWGSGYGHVGSSFAVPTKGHEFDYLNRPFVGKTLDLKTIEEFITGFVAYARTHPELDFRVTCLGCGLAGLRHDEVAPIFNKLRADQMPNVYFDTLWTEHLSINAKFWGTF